MSIDGGWTPQTLKEAEDSRSLPRDAADTRVSFPEADLDTPALAAEALEPPQIPAWLAPAGNPAGRTSASQADWSWAALTAALRDKRIWLLAAVALIAIVLGAAWSWLGAPDSSTEPSAIGSTSKTASPTDSARTTLPAKTEPSSVAPAAGRRRVLIIVPREGFWIPDYQPVRDRLEANNIVVRVASSQTGTAGGRQTFDPPDTRQAQVDVTVAEAVQRIDEFDAIYFVGKPPQAGRNEYASGGSHADDAGRLIRAAMDRGKIVSSLCRGTVVLFDAGVLTGREASRGRNISDLPADGGVRWRRGEAVVRDGQLLTGADPPDAPAFAERLLDMLAGREPAAP